MFPTLHKTFPQFLTKEKLKSDHTLYPFVTKYSHVITLAEYIERITNHIKIQPQICTLAYNYIYRILKTHKLLFSHECEYKLLAVALNISMKMWEDELTDDVFFCKVAGISSEEYIQLEKLFLELLQYKCFVHGKEYTQFIRLFMNERFYRKLRL